MKKLINRYICVMVLLFTFTGYAQWFEGMGGYAPGYGSNTIPPGYASPFTFTGTNQLTGVTITTAPSGPNWGEINAQADAQMAALAATVALNLPKQPVIPPPTSGIIASAPPKPAAQPPIPKPNPSCETLQKLNEDNKYKEKLAEVIAKAKTDSTKEYGYAISKGASDYVAGTNNALGNLTFPNKSQIYGYIHDHTLPRATVDANGNPTTTVYVQMFSSVDISTFLDALNYTATNGVAIADVFSTLVDNTGNVYTLKYEGTYNDIQGKSIDVNALQNAYDTNFSDPDVYGGIESAFASFLELDVKIPGIVVYKTTPGAAPIKLGFTSNGTRISPSNTPCK